MNQTNEHQSDIIVGLDIGTTKVVAIAGHMNEFGKINILGMGVTESYGVNRGIVTNINKTVDAIESAVSQCEESAGMDIQDVYVGIAGQHISCLQHKGYLLRERSDEEVITEEDINKLIKDMHKLVLKPGDRILHVLPQEFTVDNEHGIKDPVGSYGNRLEANFHIITGQIAAAKNIYKCVEKTNIGVNNLILEPLASAAAVLSDEEKEAGVALVDIGGGTSDLAIFEGGIIRHTSVIPMGGNIITDDIQEGCKILRSQAEQLKIRFGSALPQPELENKVIAIKGLRGREPKEISANNLAKIINARMEDIVESVIQQIKISGYDSKLIGGIVVTGGGSQLAHIKQFFEFHTGKDTRIGYPTEHLSKCEIKNIGNPMFATSIGLIMQGIDESRKTPRMNRNASLLGKPAWWNKLVKAGTKWFTPEELGEFRK